MRRTDPHRLHAGLAGVALAAIPCAGDPGVSVREPPRGPKRTLGPGLDRGQDEGVPVAKAGAGGPVRFGCGYFLATMKPAENKVILSIGAAPMSANSRVIVESEEYPGV